MKPLRQILFIFFVSMSLAGAYAQMQGLITGSSERHTRAIAPMVNSVKVERLEDDRIITLCLDSTNGGVTSYFVLTQNGDNTAQYDTLAMEVMNFRILNDLLFFCGRYNGMGFIAWADINTMFNGGNYEMHYISVSEYVFDLEAYKEPSIGQIKVVALGYKQGTDPYRIIDYEIQNNSNSQYNFAFTNDMLHCITQTKNYISIVYTSPGTPGNGSFFGVSRHDKSAVLNNYVSQNYRYAYNGHLSNRIYKPFYITESEYNSDKIFVGTTLEGQNGVPNYVSVSYDIGMYEIDLGATLPDLLQTQIVCTEGKPYVKDMVYDENSRTLYLLANVSLGPHYNGALLPQWDRADVIYGLEMGQGSDYACNLTIPNNSRPMCDMITSITLYDSNKYYIVAGKYNFTGTLYWFDRKLSATASSCFTSYPAKVYHNPSDPMGSSLQFNHTSNTKIHFVMQFGNSATIISTSYID